MRALIRFGKNKRLRFVSHLDLQRFFQRALNRTNLPIAFSQGFNPHPIMSFASALAVGWTSAYEVLDLKLCADASAEIIMADMRRALPDDLPIFAVRLVDDRFPASMALVKRAAYKINVPQDVSSAVAAQIPAYLAKDTVMGMRKTKSGVREIDIRPLTFALKKTDDGFYAELALTEKDTLKPDVLVRALCDAGAIAMPEITVHRICLSSLDANGLSVPLMEWTI